MEEVLPQIFIAVIISALVALLVRKPTHIAHICDRCKPPLNPKFAKELFLPSTSSANQK